MAASTDPSIITFEDLLTEYVGKVSSIAAKIRGQVQDITNVLGEAFSVQKDLLIKIKQTKVSHKRSGIRRRIEKRVSHRFRLLDRSRSSVAGSSVYGLNGDGCAADQ
ncbi:hypothetical protein L1887_23420 [Cichorium endivia]|nr:hypothetical protein L1887_23420 [Cichorium endivia]